ncbi:uncharacterized protein TM35_000112350 [Trypanosoma theileri]|uniref:Uncharacterized protein n=1 Tax=Trypanosoma theileri TaxID=67003 RepID=A0A1X0NYM3_9TRYP|nr:uncharacterized protein TM35_000112350 [Trypanosoma theileri]ORC89701.1 hypothetical protein TM35_000112350 [Trypanosoma theileri]
MANNNNNINNSLFVTAVTSFIHNVVAIGACSSEECINSFNSSLFTLPCSPHSCVPVVPLPLASIEEAITAETFPLGMIGRRLCSSFKQLEMFVEEFVGVLFHTAQHTFGCSLSTLLHSLWLLERMQVKNILLQQKNTISLRNASQSMICSKTNNNTEENILSVEFLPPITLGGVPLNESSCGNSNISSNSSSNPIASDDKSKGVPLLLSPTSSDLYSVGPISESEDDTLCRACAGSHVFGVQLWNVQLFLTAALLLSMKVNEDAFVDVDEEVLSRHVGAAAGCDSNLLRCAERCMFEVLWDELKVTEKGQASVMRRLGMGCPSF